MKQRLLVAAVGVPALMVILLALPPVATTVLVCLIAGIAAYELIHTAAKAPRPITYILTIACALVCVVNIELPEIIWPAAAFLLLTALCLIAVLTHGKESAMPFSDVSLCMLAGVVFPVMYSCIAYLRQTGRVLVLMPFVIAFVEIPRRCSAAWRSAAKSSRPTFRPIRPSPALSAVPSEARSAW